MRLKIFTAPNFPAAMAKLRAELGPDALILGTRTLADGIEITAALDKSEPTPAQAARIATTPDPALRAMAAFHGIPEALIAQYGPDPAALVQGLRCASLPLGPTDRPLFLVGPPGAGKTLVAVKLATRLVMAGTPPLLINADGKRAGAHEQLAAFTQVLGLELVEASEPVPLAHALARRSAQAALIDGPGTGAVNLGELAALAGAGGARMALVLPAGLDVNEAADIARAYAGIGVDLLVPTRLDLTRRLGGIVAAAQAGAMALTEASIGPAAAQDLLALTPNTITDRLRDHGVTRHAA
jgi:flagellar biosynthesis protein FlhF